jgi:hypothetical protein
VILEPFEALKQAYKLLLAIGKRSGDRCAFRTVRDRFLALSKPKSLPRRL